MIAAVRPLARSSRAWRRRRRASRPSTSPPLSRCEGLAAGRRLCSQEPSYFTEFKRDEHGDLGWARLGLFTRGHGQLRPKCRELEDDPSFSILHGIFGQWPLTSGRHAPARRRVPKRFCTLNECMGHRERTGHGCPPMKLWLSPLVTVTRLSRLGPLWERGRLPSRRLTAGVTRGSRPLIGQNRAQSAKRML